MQLYDMLTKFDEDIFEDLPLEVQDYIKNMDKYRFNNQKKSVDIMDIENIWKDTKKVCERYINENYYNYFKNESTEFLEDIKYHSIINIFISIKNRDVNKVQSKPLQPLIDDYYDISSKIFEDMNETQYRRYKGDKRDFYDNFMKKLHEWENENSSRDIQHINWGSDFIFGFDKSIELVGNGAYNIRLDQGILYESIKNWKDSPYNEKNIYGMKFERLKVFYEALLRVIDTKSDCVEKIITAYTIERFFNIAFIYELASFLNEKFYEYMEQGKLIENIIQTIEIVLELQKLNSKKIKIDREILRKTAKNWFKKEVAVNILKYIDEMEKHEIDDIINTILNSRDLIDLKKIIDILKKIITKSGKGEINNELEYINVLSKTAEEMQKNNENKLLNEFLILHKDIYLDKSRNGRRIAQSLCTLAELVSLPMVFSRNKYIRSLNFFIEKCDADDYFWDFRFRHKLYYISTFLIPLVSKVYYYLMYSLCKSENRNDEETLNYIENTLRNYMINNEKVFNLNEITLSKKSDKVFKANDTSEGFQVNLTEMIYNYRYERENIDEGIDIFELIKELDSEKNINYEVLRFKYNYNNYYHNFPYNIIHSTYYNKNSNKL